MASVAPASGSVFSLLPPDNATGNFTKIVQRVPVRIQVPFELAEQGVLRPGMSVVVSVNTKPGAVASVAGPHRVAQRAATKPSASPWPNRRHRSWRHARARRAADADRIDPRRLIAFLCMVFGMFMAILDIQIVSASLTEIQAGLAASCERNLLGADRLSDRRSRDDPALRLPVARARHAHAVRDLRGGLHRREPDVRAFAPRSTR